MPVAERKTNHPYVSIDPKISGGEPIICDTRIKVVDIAIRYELMGMSADRIIDEYPHLRLEQVHDALSYYYENKDMLDKRYKEDQSFLAQLKQHYPSKLQKKLDGVIQVSPSPFPLPSGERVRVRGTFKFLSIQLNMGMTLLI
ncbi:MAG: DUF433 domain-containing protein [Nitrospirota bacterium]